MILFGGGICELGDEGLVLPEESVFLFMPARQEFSQIPAALESIERFSVITGLSHADVASHLVILYPIASATGVGFSRLDDLFYTALRDSAATPEEFFEAVRVTRNLVLSGRMDLDAYLDRLSALLGLGLSPDEIRGRMEGP